jgi:alpha-beta hydrolase superfamily lysophospholipase
MFRSLFLLLFVIVLTSCSLNKIFLHPYVLHTTDDFSTYVEEVDDTLTMTFSENCVPIVVNSKGKTPNLSYSLENIFFPNSKGDSLNAWLFTPKENFNGQTIYFLHGNAGHLVYQFNFATPFVNAGYQVFIQDYSGFGFSGGKATRKNVYQDGQDGFDYLLSREDVKYDKLLIYGQSLGGHLASVIATDNQDKIDALVIEGAFSSHKDIAAGSVPVLGRIFTREIYSAEKSLPNFHKPILIIHSTEDTRIPYSHGERLLEVANEPKELYTIKEKHIRGPIYYADSIVAKMKRLVE